MCEWKEYKDNQGRSYFSNGSTSVWEMPEAYRIWKEKQTKGIKGEETSSSTTASSVNGSSSSTETKKSEEGRDLSRYHVSSTEYRQPISFSMDASEMEDEAPNTDSLQDNNNNEDGELETSESGEVGLNEKEDTKMEEEQEEEEEEKIVEPTNEKEEEEEEEVEEDLTSHLPPREAFEAMLVRCDVTFDMPWKDVVSTCEDEREWNVLKRGEKRQLLAEFQNKLQKKQKDIQKLKKKKTRDDFLRMLASSHNVESRSRWDDVRDELRGDVRFEAVESERDREGWFYEFIGELGRREREEEIEVKTRGKNELNDFLKTLSITANSKWEEWREVIQQKVERSDRMVVLHDGEVRHQFEDILSEIIREEDEKRRREAKEKKQIEVDLRDTLDEMLEKMKRGQEVRGGVLITPSSNYDDFERRIREDYLKGIVNEEEEEEKGTMEEEGEIRMGDRVHSSSSSSSDVKTNDVIEESSTSSSEKQHKEEEKEENQSVHCYEIFQKLNQMKRGRARRMFEDFLDDIRDEYRRDKRKMNDFLKCFQIKIRGTTDQIDFMNQVKLILSKEIKKSSSSSPSNSSADEEEEDSYRVKLMIISFYDYFIVLYL